MIKHFPITNTDKVIEHYSQKDNVPISYVCTTDLKYDDAPEDIFYRETPHPEFGNKYFAIRIYGNNVYISNADNVEDFTFGMVEDDDGNLQYSQMRHECKSFDNGNMIDGGRNYIRHGGSVAIYVIRDGQMVKDVS
jgi:hypothetical protein